MERAKWAEIPPSQCVSKKETNQERSGPPHLAEMCLMLHTHWPQASDQRKRTLQDRAAGPLPRTANQAVAGAASTQCREGGASCTWRITIESSLNSTRS